MEFANAVARAWAEYPPRWDFVGWTHQTDLACTQEARDAIHEYGAELQRRASEIVAAAQDHRDIADINDEQSRGSKQSRSTSPRDQRPTI